MFQHENGVVLFGSTQYFPGISVVAVIMRNGLGPALTQITSIFVLPFSVPDLAGSL